MQKRKFLMIFVIFILVITILIVIAELNNKKPNNTNLNNEAQNNKNTITNINENTEGENNMSVEAIINDKVFKVNIEDNETAKEFLEILPKEFNMNELNGNEKYIYLNTTFKTNSYNPKRVEAGDIMLYGNNCIVVFYKTFSTSYSYTKIGHIDNLPDLGNGNIKIKFEKNN